MIEPISPDEMPLTIVFVDRENTARSLMAEAILRHVSHGRVRAFSAGMDPGPDVDPDTLGTLAAARVPADGLKPKPLRVCCGTGAPAADFVITLADSVADDVVAAWQGPGRHVHWPMEDPMGMSGTRRVAFDHVRRKLEAAIDELIRSARSDPLVMARLTRTSAEDREFNG